LREAASRLTDSVRSYDAVSRYRGEEFLIVLNGCTADMAARRAESIRNVIHSRVIDTEIGAIPVSISLGVAVLNTPSR